MKKAGCGLFPPIPGSQLTHWKMDHKETYRRFSHEMMVAQNREEVVATTLIPGTIWKHSH